MTHDPDVLSEYGAEITSGPEPGRVLLIACGALAREILAIREMNGWDQLDLACLPAKLHNRPEQIPEAVRSRVRRARREGYGQIFVVYADCGTGGLLDTICREEDVQRIEGPHCYSFFEGNQTFAAHPDEFAAFYLTDFLARQFETLIWQGMGFDRHPELVAMMFGNYEKLIYLAQTEDAELDHKARDAAARLGLSYERRQTGYGDLTAYLRHAAGK